VYEYLDRVKEELKTYSYGSDLASHRVHDQAQSYQQFRDCMENAGRRLGENLVGNIAGVASDCDRALKVMGTSYYDQLVKSGLETPSNFLKRIEKEKKHGHELRNIVERDDVFEVVKDFTAFSEIEVEEGVSLVADAHSANLATQVHSILIELYQSEDAIVAIDRRQQREEIDLEHETKYQVLRFGELLAGIQEDQRICSGGFQVYEEDIAAPNQNSMLLKRVVAKDGSAKIASEAFFGVSLDQLKRVKVYRIVQGDEETWLYRKNDEGRQEVWVMATWDGDGVRYNHYVVKAGPQEELLDRHEGLSLINKVRHGSRRYRNGRTTLFETEAGIRIDANFEELPEIGSVPIPDGQIHLGSARLRSFSPKVGSDHQVNLNIDQVELVSGLTSTDGSWSVAGRMSYKTFDDQWRSGVNARVYNLVGGFSSDLSGKEQYHVGLIVKRNYISVDVDEGSTNLNLGRQFANRSGGVTVSSDFKKDLQLRLFIFLQ
jgi:hypothetical protein